VSSLSPNNKPICDTTCRPSFARVNPDTIGCLWTGEVKLNTLRVDGEIFESVTESKSCGFKNIRVRVNGTLHKREKERVVECRCLRILYIRDTDN